MFVLRCIPVVGTAINAFESVEALIDGDGPRAASKLGQAFIGGGLDALFFLSGGASCLVTAPLKAGLIEGGKFAGRKALERMIVNGAVKVTTNLAGNMGVRAVTQAVAGDSGRGGGRRRWGGGGGAGSSSGKSTNSSSNTKNRSSRGYQSSANTGSNSGNDPPRQNTRLPREHEVDCGYGEELEVSASNQITEVKLGEKGRVEELKARIKFSDLREGPRQGQGYTERVLRFVENLNKIKGQKKEQGEKFWRDGDEVGHIIGDRFSGPTDKTYNFFPQSPSCNMDYSNFFEKNIYDYLAQNGQSAYVNIHVMFDYVDYHGLPNRPRSIRIKVEYSNGLEEEFLFSNA